MEERLEFECPECGEEFSIGATFAQDPDRLLLCPCCGNTDVKRVGSRRAFAGSHSTAE